MPSTISPRFQSAFGILPLSGDDATFRHSGMVRQHQTRNLEIPGSILCTPRKDCLGRRDRALDLTKADAISIALAPAAHRYRIAIFQKRPLDAVRQFEGLAAVPR